MTAEELREIDHQIAERIFGQTVTLLFVKQEPECGTWEVCYCHSGEMDQAEQAIHDQVVKWNGHRLDLTVPGKYEPEIVPHYATDIKAAMDLLDHFDGKYHVTIHRAFKTWDVGISNSDGYGMVSYAASSLSLAICRAALHQAR